MSTTPPNILFIMSDDHASHAMSCYGSRINETPHLDRIAAGGMRFDNCFCTNAISSPSRAAILTGTYNHVNGVTTLATHLDNRLVTLPSLLQQRKYQTALFGKWHLGHGPSHDPAGFDTWKVLPGQGRYHNPTFYTQSGEIATAGYVTDIVTDMCMDWLDQRDAGRPFFLCCHHKAPHRAWEPDYAHALMYEHIDIPEPPTLFDDYDTRSSSPRQATLRMENLVYADLKRDMPDGMTDEQQRRWRYQRYIKDYLRCVASIDDNVGRILDYLDHKGLADNTIVIYTSDQGFFLGDHNWFDKRFMYEQSLRMPLLIRWPGEITPESTCSDIVVNVDFAATMLDCADIDIPDSMQGRSFRPQFTLCTPGDWRQEMYYRYWMNGLHGVNAHYGIRTDRHKLICYYNDPLGQPGAIGEHTPCEWELYDLHADCHELRNIYGDPGYAQIQNNLLARLARVQTDLGDEPYSKI